MNLKVFFIMFLTVLSFCNISFANTAMLECQAEMRQEASMYAATKMGYAGSFGLVLLSVQPNKLRYIATFNVGPQNISLPVFFETTDVELSKGKNCEFSVVPK